jgi:hypothetical protein
MTVPHALGKALGSGRQQDVATHLALYRCQAEWREGFLDMGARQR